MAKTKPTNCPCGSGALDLQCCARYLTGLATAADALSLMRSRYTAYVRDDQRYLQATWHPRSRPAMPALTPTSAATCKWIGLKIIRHEQHGATATVEFIASYKMGGRAQQLHEVSQFECEDGLWLYIDGQFPDTE